MFNDFFRQPKFSTAKGFTLEWWQRRAAIVLGKTSDQTDQEAIDLCLRVGQHCYDAKQAGKSTAIWSVFAELTGAAPFFVPEHLQRAS